MKHFSSFSAFFLCFWMFSPMVRATVSQVDGTIVPILENCEVWAAINHGEGLLNPPLTANSYYNFCPPAHQCTGGPLCLDAQRDADTHPQMFLPMMDRLVDFTNLMEQAGYENTFGWYNVGNPYARFPVFTCTPVNHEPFAQIFVDFDAEFLAGRYEGGYIGFYIITPEGNASGVNCGTDNPPNNFGHIYFTEAELNGDGDYVHNLVYTSRQNPYRFYFAFEDLFRGGDNDFSDYVIRVEGLVPPCIPEPEVCDGRDNDCNGLIDDDPLDAGGTCGSDVGECDFGTIECVGGILLCVGGTVPQPEICDGKDNNCNGIIDDFPTGEGETCGTDVGECDFGITTCIGGHMECVGATLPELEFCNGRDNDCDGETDNNPVDAGRPCGTDVGECDFGITACIGGVLVCDGGILPVEEVCDGRDNDCNGLIDDNPVDVGQPCGTSVGICMPGITACVNGTIQCVGGISPAEEICDGLDNNCNGEIDEGNPGGGGPCGPAEAGECRPGTWNCRGGRLVCEDAVLPGIEVCDCRDNNCNGLIDDNALCPANTVCIDCQCVSPCQGEFCPQGMDCIDGYCIPNVCFGVSCPRGEMCSDGICVNLCDLQTCPDDTVCDRTRGVCVEDNCYGIGCPEGEICLDTTCVPDLCLTTECPEDQFCRFGECVPSCVHVICGYRQRCEDGVCIPDPCHRMECEDGETCENGSCVDDPCRGVFCGTGRVCRDGTCVDDPCRGVLCPEGVCMNGQCVHPVDQRPGTPPKRVTTSGGGCSVANPGSSTNFSFSFWLVLLGILAGSAIRKRYLFPAGTLRLFPLVFLSAILAGSAGCDRAFYEIYEEESCADDCRIPNARSECVEGECRFLGCIPGFYNHDGNPENGCEYECTPTNDGVEICDGIDNNCDGRVDEFTDFDNDIHNCGACDNSCFLANSITRCDNGACLFEECLPGFIDLDGDLEPGSHFDLQETPDLSGCEYQCFVTNDGVEICDGLDNDCNGHVDDGDDLDTDPDNCGACGRRCLFNNADAVCIGGVCVMESCHEGFYDIANGDLDGCEYACEFTNGGVETCDGRDNDCNGLIDDVAEPPQLPLHCGSCGRVCSFPHQAAICNDNFECEPADCNENWWNLDPDIPGCEYYCVPSAGGVEICDGLDNNCNGFIDEGNPGGGVPCGFNNLGICRMGVTSCVAGELQCIGAVYPETEVCDGLDNNCSGEVDEGNPGGGDFCGFSDVGACELGTITCVNGHLICIGAVNPAEEICDGIDNNCDGDIDLPGCQYVTGGDVRVDSGTTAGQYNSIQVSAASSGSNIYVAWNDNRGEARVYFNRSTNHGASFLNEYRVHTSSNHQLHPKLLVHPVSGTIFLYWEEFFSNQRDVQITRSTNNGSSFATPIRAFNSTLDSMNSHLSLSSDALFLLREDYREQVGSTLPYRNIYLNVSTNNGQNWTADIRVNRGAAVTSSFAMRAMGAVGAGDRFFVVFEDARNGKHDIYLNYTDNRGTTWQASDIRISRGTPGATSSTRPFIVTHNDGSVYVFYEDIRVGTVSSIYMNRSLDNGVTWLDEDVLLSSGIANAHGVSAQVAPDGWLHVVFQDYSQGLPLIRSMTAPDGIVFVSAIVDTRRGFSSTPKLQLSATGNPMVAYLDNRDGFRDVYVNFSLDRGMTFHPLDLRMDQGTAPGAADAKGIQLVPTHNGQGAGVAWFDPRTNGLQSDVFFKSTAITW